MRHVHRSAATRVRRIVPAFGLAATFLIVGSGGTGPFSVHAAGTVGAVQAWGYDYYDQLGYGLSPTPPAPYPQAVVGVPLATPVNGQTGVSGVAAGGSHSLALKGTNVFGWGRDFEGQLGDGGSGSANTRKTASVEAETAASTPLSGVTALGAGTNHSIALKSDNTVWDWGSNSFGQLGNGTNTASSFAVQVETAAATNLTGISAVAAGGFHSLALKSSDGSVWAWGSNANGELGDGTTSDNNFAVEVKTDSTHFLTSVTDIAAGHDHSLAVKSDGSVWAWGLNSNGQLGNGDSTKADKSFATQVVGVGGVGNFSTGTATGLAWPLHRISGGDYHSTVLRSDGTVWSWGSDNRGSLGDGGTTGLNDSTTPVSSPTSASPSLTPAQSVSAGGRFTIALLANGAAVAWGDDGLGELGDGTLGDVTPSNPTDPTSGCFCRSKAVPVLGIAQSSAVAGGGAHTLAVAG